MVCGTPNSAAAATKVYRQAVLACVWVVVRAGVRTVVPGYGELCLDESQVL